MKILYVTTVGVTMGFFKDFIRQLLDEGNTVDIAANDREWAVPDCFREWGCSIYQVDCSRSPVSPSNIKAVKQIKKLVSENKYDIVHCHTPVAGICARTACRHLRRSQGTKVIYTAHGFHFFKGAPAKNWLMFYPFEWLCAHWTDALITINTEDFALAQKHMHAGKVRYVHGVGVDIERFENHQCDRAAKRRELGVPDDAFLLLSVGELNPNKNHETVLKAVRLADNLSGTPIYYIIAGKGELKESLSQAAAELGLQDRFELLGYRTDVPGLYKTADLFVHPSFREGLPVSAMEAIASGLPVICSDIRGCRDLVASPRRFAPDSPEQIAALIATFSKHDSSPVVTDITPDRANLSSFNIRNVIVDIKSIYAEVLG